MHAARRTDPAIRPWSGSARQTVLIVLLAVTLAFGLSATAASAQDSATPAPSASAPAPGTLGPSGQPLPRFVSLRSGKVNMRAGPGMRYPVEWVYRRRGLPMEVLRETERWRQVRDPDGTEGWVHMSMLSGSERRAMVRAEAPPVLLRRPEAQSEGIARIEHGVVVKVLQCPQGGGHCRVEAGRFQGWLGRAALWGVYPSESLE